MFQPVESSVNFPKLEEEILRFWQEAKIYEKSLERRRAEGANRFVFYEGPPTANGMPHPGHCLTRAIKDLFPRYRTMRGYLCERKAGWDTHGLPVEVEVCKELGIHSKEDIENYGIEPFIQKCQQSVWRYMREWRRMTERIGFWVNLDEAYVTYHQSYVESVWWSLKQLFDRGLLYQGYKIVWWWAQGGTALSAGEVGQGYREVADPSVYVKFPLLDESTGDATGESLVVWTTTPWTLPSNQYAAVHPDLEYCVVTVEVNGSTERLIVAEKLLETLRAKVRQELPEVDTRFKGITLIGHRYRPPFDYYYKSLGSKKGQRKDGLEDYLGWRIVGADFVTTDSGTGIVHQAPAFGEVDFDVLTSERNRFKPSDVEYDKNGVAVTVASLPFPELINAVDSSGKFTDEAPEYCRGRWVKDCDKDIIHDLKNRGLLFHREEYRHEYPFCWRAEEDPLIQYPRRSWFIKTSEFKQQMLDNNQHINWLPEHIKNGRFGNFLESNVDWALSRERFWGTPLPIWVCEQTGKMEAVANYDELLKKPGVKGTEVWDAAKKTNPDLADDLKVHKPYIDEITYDSPFETGARMRRVTEVIDCWYDSGAMPFAQWGYQGEGQKVKESKSQRASSTIGPFDSSTPAANFHQQFPADFISEALDQTRGWFYSQLAISTLVFDKPIPRPFKNCIVLGLMLGEDGQKMSKSKRNYREPGEIFDKYGADALRWYFFATQPPWTTIRYSERAIRDSIPEFLLRLWHTYSFFVIYANIDGFDPLSEIYKAAPAGRDSLPLPRGEGRGERGPAGAAACGLASADLATAKSYRPIRERAELDRWILSELNRTAAAVVERLDQYDNYTAAQKIIEFVDALSNWYVRRSRDRFWSEDKRDPDKLDAYWTLYECLLTTAKIIAPFVPFIAEAIWQNLAGKEQPASRPQSVASLESVHLCDFPTGNESIIDEELSSQMELVREISSLGRSARATLKMPVRQPLRKMTVILVDESKLSWLQAHTQLLANEVNVKDVEFTTHSEEYISRSYELNFKVAGPKLGALRPAVQKAISKEDPEIIFNSLSTSRRYIVRFQAGISAQVDEAGQLAGTATNADETFELLEEDLQLKLKAKPGWAASHGKASVVLLPMEPLSPKLLQEGVAREIVHALQDRRKARNCQYTDRIVVALETQSDKIKSAVEEFGGYVKRETLAEDLRIGTLPAGEKTTVNIAGDEVTIHMKVTFNVSVTETLYVRDDANSN